MLNGHPTLTYARPFFPNVAEIACVHCKEAEQLPNDLEEFVGGNDNGFIYVSMGSSVKAANMPNKLRRIMLEAFSYLPYKVLWKWERGLLSMFETVYHGCPTVTIPVFCDHDANAAKAVLDGFAIKLNLQTLSSRSLAGAIEQIIKNDSYKAQARSHKLSKHLTNAFFRILQTTITQRSERFTS
uniref:CSON002583 protein n=1 Tax=Culicoides sonorensis TaxID=179676 RepID=A0A336LS21_CULSO